MPASSELSGSLDSTAALPEPQPVVSEAAAPDSGQNLTGDVGDGSQQQHQSAPSVDTEGSGGSDADNKQEAEDALDSISQFVAPGRDPFATMPLAATQELVSVSYSLSAPHDILGMHEPISLANKAGDLSPQHTGQPWHGRTTSYSPSCELRSSMRQLQQQPYAPADGKWAPSTDQAAVSAGCDTVLPARPAAFAMAAASGGHALARPGSANDTGLSVAAARSQLPVEDAVLAQEWQQAATAGLPQVVRGVPQLPTGLPYLQLGWPQQLPAYAQLPAALLGPHAQQLQQGSSVCQQCGQRAGQQPTELCAPHAAVSQQDAVAEQGWDAPASPRPAPLHSSASPRPRRTISLRSGSRWTRESAEVAQADMATAALDHDSSLHARQEAEVLVRRLQLQVDELEHSNAELTHRLKAAESATAASDRDCVSARAQCTQHAEEVARLQGLLRAREGECEALQRRAEGAADEARAAREEVDRQRACVQAAADEGAGWRERAIQLERELAAERKRAELLASEQRLMEGNLARARKEGEMLGSQAALRDDAIHQLREQLQAARMEAKAMEKRAAAAAVEAEALRGEVAGLRPVVGGLEREVARLRAGLTSAQGDASDMRDRYRSASLLTGLQSKAAVAQQAAHCTSGQHSRQVHLMSRVCKLTSGGTCRHLERAALSLSLSPDAAAAPRHSLSPRVSLDHADYRLAAGYSARPAEVPSPSQRAPYATHDAELPYSVPSPRGQYNSYTASYHAQPARQSLMEVLPPQGRQLRRSHDFLIEQDRQQPAAAPAYGRAGPPEWRAEQDHQPAPRLGASYPVTAALPPPTWAQEAAGAPTYRSSVPDSLAERRAYQHYRPEASQPPQTLAASSYHQMPAENIAKGQFINGPRSPTPWTDTYATHTGRDSVRAPEADMVRHEASLDSLSGAGPNSSGAAGAYQAGGLLAPRLPLNARPRSGAEAATAAQPGTSQANENAGAVANAKLSPRPYATDISLEELMEQTKAMEERLLDLNVERSQLESEYARMPAGGGRTLKERRRKAEVEQRMEEVEREASNLRLNLRKLGVK